MIACYECGAVFPAPTPDSPKSEGNLKDGQERKMDDVFIQAGQKKTQARQKEISHYLFRNFQNTNYC